MSNDEAREQEGRRRVARLDVESDHCTYRTLPAVKANSGPEEFSIAWDKKLRPLQKYFTSSSRFAVLVRRPLF